MFATVLPATTESRSSKLLFNSVEFFVFLAAAFLLYYLPLLRRYQAGTLLLSSLIFYSVGERWGTGLLIAIICYNALLSFHLLAPQQNRRTAKVLVITAIAANIAILCWFKYSGLFTSSLEAANIGVVNDSWIRIIAMVPLPIGISFYCFEGISLVVDCFRGRFTQRETFWRHFRKTALFIAFFPHLISGPILRAADFYPQIKPKSLRDVDWYFCFKWMVLGYFFKVVVADNLAQFTFFLRHPWFESFSLVKCIALLFAYAVQFFADFAGYSYIALGIAALLGYSIPLNFNAPFISKSMTELWHRWNISLSEWIRDYLYIPLGGSRRSWIRATFNVILVMVLAGLWHGAHWKFALWGLIQGIVLMFEHLVAKFVKLPEHGPVAALRIASTFLFFSLSLFVFRLGDNSEIIEFLKYVVKPDSVLPVRMDLELFTVFLYASPVLIWHTYCWLLENKPDARITKSLRTAAVKVAAFTIMIVLSLLNSGPSSVFMYFQF